MRKVCVGDVCGTESCKDVIYVSLYNSFLFFTIETENRITEELCCYPGLFHKLSTLNKINMKIERQPQTVRNPKTRKSTESVITQIFWKWICASLSLKIDYPWSPVFLGQPKKDLELGTKRKADVRMALMVALSLHLKAIPNLEANNEEHKQHSQGIYYHPRHGRSWGATTGFWVQDVFWVEMDGKHRWDHESFSLFGWWSLRCLHAFGSSATKTLKAA